MRIDLLAMRFTVLIAAFAVLVYIGIDNGTVPYILAKDTSLISEGILAFFAFGVLLCAFRVFECSIALNKAKHRTRHKFYLTKDSFEIAVRRRWEPIDLISRLLFRAGLMGTVYGFIVALGNVDFANLTSASLATTEIGHIIDDMHIALVTTLVGVTTNIILAILRRTLEGGYERLYGLTFDVSKK